MKKTISSFAAIIFTLALIVIIASFLDFIFLKLAALFTNNVKETANNIDISISLFNLVGIGIPYILYLIIFKVIIRKRISLKVKGIITCLIACSFYEWAINTFTIGRPNFFDLNVFIPLIVFFVSGFSLPFVDEFFVKKFGLKEAE